MPRRAVTDVPQRKAEFIEPMECALVPKLPEGPQWTFEAKLDGYRAIGVRTSETILYSRNHKNFNKRFPQIAEALGDLPADTVKRQPQLIGWSRSDDSATYDFT